MNYDQIMREIENLSDTIYLIDNTMKHNIDIFWTALGIGLALVGLVSAGWLRYYVSEQVEKRLKVEVASRLKDYTKKPEYITPSLVMGWIGSNIHYWKDRDGYVTLDGIIEGGISGQKMMNFPRGYHPHQDLKIPLICSSGSGFCTIGEDGFVVINAPTEAIVRFGNIRFKANEVN